MSDATTGRNSTDTALVSAVATEMLTGGPGGGGATGFCDVGAGIMPPDATPEIDPDGGAPPKLPPPPEPMPLTGVAVGALGTKKLGCGAAAAVVCAEAAGCIGVGTKDVGTAAGW